MLEEEQQKHSDGGGGAVPCRAGWFVLSFVKRVSLSLLKIRTHPHPKSSKEK